MSLFLNNLRESNSQLNVNLENVHIQSFIGLNRLLTLNLVSLLQYKCCIRDCYVRNVING